jgi:hypothetical protein
MKAFRIVVLLVIGLLAGYVVGSQRINADCLPLTCQSGGNCLAYDSWCDGSCESTWEACLYSVGRCHWPNGPVCSIAECITICSCGAIC